MRRIVLLVVVALVMATTTVAIAMPSFGQTPGHAAQGKHISKAVLTARDATPPGPCGPAPTEQQCRGQTIATVAKGGEVVVPE